MPLLKYIFFITALLLTACRHEDKIQKTSRPLKQEDIKLLTKPLPALPINYPPQQVKPTSPRIAKEFYKKISFTLSNDISLKDGLNALLKSAQIDGYIDPNIIEKINLQVQDTPFIHLIERIADSCQLRYKIHGKFIRIEKDSPYPKTYPVQFLNLSRKTENKISIATDVFSNTASSVGDNGSNSQVTLSSQNDFWQELENNLKVILANESNASYVINKFAGLISVSGTTRQHRYIEEYLEQLRQATSMQVLIEAKIVEVTLKDQYKSGINWSKLTPATSPGMYTNVPLGTLAQTGGNFGVGGTQGNLLTFGLQRAHFGAILHALQEFGASKTLSSPRLTVMNNQTAILKVAQNQVYFKINYDRQYSYQVSRESVNVSSDIQTVPIGLVMFVQPSIDFNTGEIILSVRPTISRTTQSVNDPAVGIAYSANNSSAVPTQSSVPIVEVREIDSVLKLKSGEIGVLGGLMEIRETKDESGIPILSKLFFIGEPFKANSETGEVVELVILLKASVLNGAAPIHPSDERLYHLFEDPRPLIQ